MTHTSKTTASRADPIDTETSPRTRRARSEPMDVFPLRDGSYLLETDGGRYVVNTVTGRCECPDFRIRGIQCKHLRRARLEISRGTVPGPRERSKPCGVCGRSVFVSGDQTGPYLCSRHHLDPGTFVADRESGSRLVVTSVTNERADEYLTSTGDAVNDYDTNAAYGCHEPVVKAVYLEDSLAEAGVVDVSDRKRYAFPASRLKRIPATSQPDTAVIGITERPDQSRYF